MEEVRQLVQEEGREARNLVAFHVAVDTPVARISRKPPRSLAGAPRRVPPRPARRSASAGRDKRSELRARYWALLFGDLQRAIGEIYNTVEAHENLNECQEVILVLENYTRDFKALGEWFRLKWEYDNTPPPQRPQSLAWEIRKTDFVRPESRRAHSVRSSPSVSGKNSPCLSGHNTPSGKNSPNHTGKASPGSGKISPRISSGHSNTSPKANIEFFSSKIASNKITAIPEAKLAKETSRLSDITEKDIKETVVENIEKLETSKEAIIKTSTVEIGKAKECAQDIPKQVVIKSIKRLKNKDAANSAEVKKPASDVVNCAQDITAKLNALETDFLTKHLCQNKIKNENMLNVDMEEQKSKTHTTPIADLKPVKSDSASLDDKLAVKTDEKENSSLESSTKSEDNFADISNESSKFIDQKLTNIIPEVSGETTEIEESEPQLKSSSEANKSNKASTNTTTVCAKDLSKKADLKDTYQSTEDLKKENTDVKKDNTDAKKDNTDAKKDNTDAKKDNADAKKDTKLSNDVKLPNVRPAYSQAAAKPKLAAPLLKPENKMMSKTTLARSKTVVEIRHTSGLKPARQFQKKNVVSKCSYPFNLTTGRSTLFDTSTQNKNVPLKKTTNKCLQMGSGDAKSSQIKVEVKKRVPRPASLKIIDKNMVKEKHNCTLEKINDCDEYSSSDTIVTQIDITRIESSESLKTLVPEEMEDITNSIEVLNVNKSDNEGWLTVKSRRLSRESKKQSKCHWAQRFYQPSATTSLPTLNMIESPKQETKPIINSPINAKPDRAKSEQPEVNVVLEPEKPTPVPEILVQETKAKDLSMIRQKSDVTGLKTRSSRCKALRKSEKYKDEIKDSEEGSELTKSRLHSSLESLTTGLARSQESTEDAFDFDKWKEEFKSTFKYLDDDDQIILDHDEILESADPTEISEIAEMTSQIEENEKKLGWALDFQSEVDQRKLCEEEDLLNRQILELQQVSDIDLDTETDDTETDAEILCEEASAQMDNSLAVRYKTALAGMSFAEREHTLGALEALVARDPGRAQQLHAKLSQGIKRRGSLQDALRGLQDKQARAEHQRTTYRAERARRIHQLLARVEEVKVAKNQLIDEKRLRMEKRLQKAAENRDQHLKDIVRKAHDEEEKLREIAFIKQLEAEHRRHDFLAQCRASTARLRLMRRDRIQKLEQKAAREAAVGARRLALEAARRRRVEDMLERRRLRDHHHSTLRAERTRQRRSANRQKAESVKSRLSALAAAAELEADALRSRIRDKQDASQLRLESHLQAIREKATGPRQPTTSESLDQTSKEERELAERAALLEQERRERERQRAVRKKARKLKQKLLATSKESVVTNEHIANNPLASSSKIYRVLNSLNNIIVPLIESVKEDKQTEIISNGIEVDENERNAKSGKSKIVNGDTENNVEKKKNKRKKNSPEASAKNINNNLENNNNTQTEIIIEDDKNGGNKMKNKKNKSDNDRPKLSKTNSVCSSLSDMSKCSSKCERRCKVVVDTQILERHLNELHRISERFDKSTIERFTFQKLHGLKMLNQLLALVSEREDLAPQFNTKLVTTIVLIAARVITSCSIFANCFVMSPGCVHIIRMLSDQLEKDMTDPKELELAKQLSDCLSIALDSVLCVTRLHEERMLPDDFTDLGLLPGMRSRAHALISYLCLSGVITHAESAGEARENIQTLLTVSADLCHPCDIDVGSERSMATASLRRSLGTGVCGSRAEFCGLFARGAHIAADGGRFVRAARTAHLLRALAELDYNIVQECFGEAGWPLEFRAAVARLLSQHAPSDKEAPRTTALRLSNQRLDQSLSETMVLDLIVLVGFVIVNNPQLQETVLEGWSVASLLCQLPAHWLVSRAHSRALLPTLAALATQPEAAADIREHLNMQMIDEFMASPEAQNVKLVQVIKQGRAKKTCKK